MYTNNDIDFIHKLKVSLNEQAA